MRQNPKQIGAITDKNFYQLGSLLHVNIRKFGGTSQMSGKEEMERFKEDRDVLRGIQTLLLPEDRDNLRALEQIRNEVHSFIDRNSIPHELPAFAFIYNTDKKRVEEYLVKARERYIELAQFFADRWEDIEKAYAKAKPKLYRPEKYPSKYEILRRFEFSWKFCEVQSGELDQEIARMKAMVLKATKKSLIERLDVLVKGCVDGKVSQATLDSIQNNIFDKYDRLFAGFIDNVDIQEAIADLKEYLEGADAEMLRSDDVYSDMVASKAKEVAKSVKNIKDDKGGRQLLF